MQRYLLPAIRGDLSKKLILLTGPRQCGKTTLAKMLLPSPEYFTYDDAEQRLAIRKKAWDRNAKLLILDELHKMPQWKGWLKGVFDTEGLRPPIVVTGSAKLDVYKKVGDSLAGRFFQFRLHPLDLKEVMAKLKPASADAVLERLLSVGPFPEPYLEGDPVFYRRWRKSHLDIILKQDLIELENVQHIIQIETLIQMLRQRVGSPVSYSSLARDLQCDDKTVKRWLTLLENMYIVFKLTPYHHNIARSLLKQPKYYFYDTGQVEDNAARFENLVACALLKEIHFQEDVKGRTLGLCYLKNKLRQEIDFLLTEGGTPRLMVEVKLSDAVPSTNFSGFAAYLPAAIHKLQLVKDLKRPASTKSGIFVKRASDYLAGLNLDFGQG